MKRIIIHHTAGSYIPNDTDLKHYHFLVGPDGEVYKGRFKPEDNENCQDGKYAAHTFKGNTGSIGIAACCNFNFSLTHPESSTKFPLTKKQFERICKLSAELCIKYKINPLNIHTHYEFDKLHNIKQGKVDITYLPFNPVINQHEVASYFRSKIKWYVTKCKYET